MFVAVLLYLFSTGIGERLIVIPLENTVPPLNSKVFKKVKNSKDFAILVLSGGAIDKSPAWEGHPTVGGRTLKRLNYTFYLYNNTGFPIICSGGVIPSNLDVSLARLMANILKRWGVPENKIILEEKSRNTKENIANSLNIVLRKNFKKLIIVTSAFHMPRTYLIAKKLSGRTSINVIPAPCDYFSNRKSLTFYDFLPYPTYMYHNSLAIREFIGLIYYGLILKLGLI